MALKALHPVPKEVIGNGWDLVASEGGRSTRGLQASVTLCNGTAQACRTLAMGNATEQQAVAADFAGIGGLEASAVLHALVKLGVAVEGVLRQMDTTGAQEGQSQATRLVTLATAAGAALFHSPEGDAYATIDVEGHHETWPLKVKGFRRWLARLYYNECDKAPGSQAIQDALGVL